MNSKGILRKPSPVKKRNLSTQSITVKQSNQKACLIDHNHVEFSENVCNDFAENKTKYNVSEANTTLKVAKKLEYLKKLNENPADQIVLSPRSKVVVAEKALKKLNIIPDKRIYKRLPPINVNDSILEVNRKIRKDKKTITQSSVDLEPTLNNFLRPSEELKFQLDIKDFDQNDDDDVPLARKSLATDNFQRLYGVYRQYLDPMRQSGFSQSS